MKIVILLLVCFLHVGFAFSQNSGLENINIPAVVSSANIERVVYPDNAVINLYQGNGRFGCSYGPLGLHIHPSKADQLSKYGKTQFMHLDNWVRAKYGADYLIPFAKIYWEKEPINITNYKQSQSFYDGTIVTHFDDSENKITLKTWFDPIEKDLAGFTVDVEGNPSDIILDPSETFGVHYNQQLVQVAKVTGELGLWKIATACLNLKSVIYLKTNAKVELHGSKLHIKLHRGENEIQISVNKPISVTTAKSIERNTLWWHSKWKKSGMLVLPEPNAQKMWVRSMAQFLSTYSDGGFGFPPPMGFTGNGWPFSFPQDISFIQPVLLSTGNISISKVWVEYLASEISGMKDYTKRLLSVDGVLLPWVFPYGKFEGYHFPAPPNKYYYEIHNSGYLARMAYETAIYINDDKWKLKYAQPIVKETALFYKNICSKGKDNLWHLIVKPSMGQDEMGGENQSDYLCALYSAKYCFQKAIEYHLDEDGAYKAILKDGLAFPSLLSEKGYYFTSKGSGATDFGKQKHPVQLNDLAYLPISKDINNASSIAYEYRYDLTQHANKPFFFGWTLGAFLLAGSRIGNMEEWKKDWGNLLKSEYVDADWIQVYETSAVYNASYYTTTNGLITQSLINNIISDWFGKLEIAKCIPWKGKVAFVNIMSLLGVKMSGEINGDSAKVVLTAWKNCSFELFNEKIVLKKGDRIHLNLNLKKREVVNSIKH